MTRLHRARGGFTLAELLVSMAASTVIIGALFISSMSLQKAMHGSEHYASSYSDQRRLIDFLARDLRRSIAIAATDAGGIPVRMAGQTIEVEERATLTVTLPAYYASNVPTETNFDQPMPVVAVGERLEYGTSTTPAPPVTVAFRKIFVSEEKCICFVREEAAAREVIVRDAEDLHLRVTVAADGRSSAVQVWFRSAFSTTRALITTHDEILLRNLRIDGTE